MNRAALIAGGLIGSALALLLDVALHLALGCRPA